MLIITSCTLPFSYSACAGTGSIRPGDILPEGNESSVCRLVVKMISTGNYKKVPLNDSLSALVFDRYLKSLDENHSYLLASDIKGFTPYRTQLDDDMKKGDLTKPFDMFNTYKARYAERLKYSIAELNANIDFTGKDSYAPDRKKLPFAETVAELNAIWNKRIKYDLLDLQLSDPDPAKNKEALKRKYQNLLAQSDKITAKDVFQQFMNAFTASVDPHISYFNPFDAAQFNIGISRSLEGIGASLALDNENLVIRSLTPGGPAYKTKMINPDDRIIAIAQGKDGQFQDISGWRLDNIITLIRGPKGTLVKLKILSKDKSAADEPQVIEVVRDKIILADQSAKQEIRSYKSGNRLVKVGIISIPAFYIDYPAYQSGDPNYKSTTRDVKLLLDTLKQKQVDAVMIDLRGNGGGSLNEAVSLTGLFIQSGPVVQLRDMNQQVQVAQDTNPDVYYQGPLAVLVDRTSASASEIFSAAIQDYGRGLILGAQTYGKGSIQNQLNLNKVAAETAGSPQAVADVSKQNGFGQLNLTVGKFYRITGSSTQHKGVTPDIELPSFVLPADYGEDTEPSAMPWDTVGKSQFSKAGSLEQVIPVLASQYKKRSATSPSYIAFNDMIKAFHENMVPKIIPLNIQELKLSRSLNAANALQRNNRLRLAIGLPALSKGQTKASSDDLDMIRTEAGEILTDFVQISKTAI